MSNIFNGSGYDSDSIKQLLKEAQDAYHALMTGSKAVKVQREGRMVEYNMTNKDDLRLYINELQGMLSSSATRGRRPARIRF